MKKPVLLLLLVTFSYSLFSQDDSMSALFISKELKENANAVIRNESTIVTIESVDKMRVKVSRTVTVLNKLGRSYVRAGVGYDNDREITSLSAEIFDVRGERIKKIKKKDFLDYSGAGSDLYTDNRIKTLEYTPTQYPYTIKFQYEYKTSTTGFIPRWNPIDMYYAGIEKSTYTLINETSNEIRVKEKNFEDFPIQKNQLNNGFEYSLEKVAPLKYESYSLGIENLTPELMIASSNFSLKGVMGSGNNWKDFGKWMYDKLLLGRANLDEATKVKVRELTKKANNPVDKAKIIYKYMQDKTRYISVQVGIGGWEPIAANQVDKVGYGDCKGLTNYMKALLDVVGVESYYTVVYADEQVDIDKDFASLQGTHVILNIPNSGNDLWLECTSQTTPFGFLGDFTDNRNVLVVTPEGGIIKRTPAYLNETNLQVTKATIELDNSGNLKAQIEKKSKGTQYDNSYPIEDLSKEELLNYYKTNVWSYNNNLEISSFTLENDKDSVLFTERVDVEVKEYASLNQGEYLFRVNVFNRNNNVPKRYRARKLPLKITRGYKDIDEYTIRIPEGYTIGVLPNDIQLDTKFGTYKVTFEKKDKTILIYKKELLIKAGQYPKEDYNLYRKFRRSVAKYENMRIALEKK
tara:strand:+ start:13095 stop:14996 length:1902 start_codon:yes stop_codon:yes gene_type:complete